MGHRSDPVFPLRPLFLAGLVLLAGTAQAEDVAAMARHRHASVCVAVLKRDALTLRSAAAAGDTAKKAEMVHLTEIGFAFIYNAYKDGLRKPLADQLLDEAEAAQQHQPASVLNPLSTGCQTEGTQLIADASALERMLNSKLAAARVDKLLAADKR